VKIDKKESILSAARQMIRRYGIQKTNLDELARMAKVAKATLYNYFGSKEQIYTEVLNQEANDMIRQIMSVVDEAKSPMEKLKVFIRIKYSQMKDRANMIHLPQDEVSCQSFPGILIMQEKMFNREIQILNAIIEDGVREGVFYVDNVLQAARAIGYALRGFEISSIFDEDNKMIEEIIERFYRLICNGLQAQKRGI
jgi:AcrR family transcriptional regulator